MHKALKNIINIYKEDESVLNQIIVSLFLRVNKFDAPGNRLISSLVIPDGSALSDEVTKLNFTFGFDEVIEAFELAIPAAEKSTNGAVYTPSYIKGFIVEQMLERIDRPSENLLVADISCGCGAFLFTFADRLSTETNKRFADIFAENVFGLDISESSVLRTKILLSLLAVSRGEDALEFEFNIFCGNALSFNWRDKVSLVAVNDGFDAVIGNPPYVRAKNIDKNSKALLPRWSVTKSGNPDLYIPFFEIGLSSLNENGVLGYITVNSFYKSVNARELRRYLETHRFELKIIDFGHEKIFKGISAYTCICLISKSPADEIAFKKSSSHSLISGGLSDFSMIPYDHLDYKRGWLINDTAIVENIKRIESAGLSLGKRFKIKNGIATLSNDTYIFRPVNEDEEYFILAAGGREYEIEKAICRDIIKPNILKYEHEIEKVREKLIYPYREVDGIPVVIGEQEMQSNFPKAYAYLSDFRELLDSRDKGNGDYGVWYAFGRTQALSDKGLKLMFPYMAKAPHFVFTDNLDMLIYCGYAIFSESEQELRILKRILESSVFDYYIQYTSKPYSGGYLSYAKNYVQNFGVCELNEQERYFLSNGVTQTEVDNFLIEKYELVL